MFQPHCLSTSRLTLWVQAAKTPSRETYNHTSSKNTDFLVRKCWSSRLNAVFAESFANHPNDTVSNDVTPTGIVPIRVCVQMSKTLAPAVDALKRISSRVKVAVTFGLPRAMLLIMRTAVAPAGCAAAAMRINWWEHSIGTPSSIEINTSSAKHKKRAM